MIKQNVIQNFSEPKLTNIEGHIKMNVTFLRQLEDRNVTTSYHVTDILFLRTELLNKELLVYPVL